MRGSEDQFNAIVSELAKNTKSYEEKRIKHYQWVDQTDNIFGSYGWTKAEFYTELNLRLGIETNESRATRSEAKKKLGVVKRAKQKPKA